MSKIYNVIVPEEYESSNGEVKTQYHRVGTAFENKKGFSCTLPPGIGLTGKFLLFERTDRSDKAADDGASNEGSEGPADEIPFP